MAPDSGGDVPNGPCVRQIAAGSHHICALARDGSAWCLGHNAYGSLGNGTVGGRAVAERVLGLPGPAVAVDAGGLHSCAVLEDGSLWCWGGNHSGQLGVLSPEWSVEPVRVPIGDAVTDVATGGVHTCAATEAGEVLCWGWNGYGQLGRGTKDEQRNHAPSPVLSLAGAEKVAAGDTFSCARLANGAVWCWGENYRGQLGDGYGEGDIPIYERAAPVRALEVDDASVIVAGSASTCAIRAGQSLWCWGSHLWGARPEPTGLEDIVGVGVGVEHQCALTADGSVLCWQYERTPPGYPDITGPDVFDDIGNDAVAIAATWHGTCVGRRDDALWCWGGMDLGDGELFLSDAPQMMGSLCAPAGE